MKLATIALVLASTLSSAAAVAQTPNNSGLPMPMPCGGPDDGACPKGPKPVSPKAHDLNTLRIGNLVLTMRYA